MSKMTMDEIRAAATSFDEIAAMIMANPDLVKSLHWTVKTQSRKIREAALISLERAQLLSLSFTKMKWEYCLSNSHSYPIGGVQNFSRRENTPIGYPGWRGSIEFNTSLINHADVNWFREQPFNTGSGGARSINDVSEFGYEIRLYATDWPAMYVRQLKAQEMHDEVKAIDLLSGKRRYWQRGFTDDALEYSDKDIHNWQ